MKRGSIQRRINNYEYKGIAIKMSKVKKSIPFVNSGTDGLEFFTYKPKDLIWCV